MLSISQEISAFFRAVNDADGFLFTTFSLDEQVLVALLRKHSIRTDRRIVVLHDVMKRHHPGFLRQFYPNSTVISVRLANSTAKVPIFHSKLWMGIRKKNCVALAAPSLNLRRYHLDQQYKTFDTFPWWSDLSFPLAKIGRLNEFYDLRTLQSSRRTMPARTIVIDDRNHSPAVSDHDVAAIALIRDLADGDKPIGCAAPFVGKRAIEALRNINNVTEHAPAIWSEPHTNGTALHAKLIETDKYIFLGSVNLTCQALGVNKLINHEVLIVGHRGQLKLKTVLRGFPKRTVSDLSTSEDEEPADRSPEDGIEDWSERRKLAVNGPAEVRLVLVNGQPQIRLIGSPGGASQVELLFYERR